MIEIPTADEKRAEIERKLEAERIAYAERAAKSKKERPSRYRQALSDALVQVNEEIAKPYQNTTRSVQIYDEYFNETPRLRDALIKYLEKKGYKISYDYHWNSESEYGYDGESHDTGRKRKDLYLTIKW